MIDSVEYKLRNLTLRTVTIDDLMEVARMWNFEKEEISLEEAEKAIRMCKREYRIT